jgi:hypothetical protein
MLTVEVLHGLFTGVKYAIDIDTIEQHEEADGSLTISFDHFIVDAAGKDTELETQKEEFVQVVNEHFVAMIEQFVDEFKDVQVDQIGPVQFLSADPNIKTDENS